MPTTFTLRALLLSRRWLAGGVGALGVLVATTSWAQAPTVVSLTPGRNALAAPRATSVAVVFNQALASTAAIQGALRVFSQQAGGRKAGTATVSGSTLRFQPTVAFRPGETVRATLTAAAQSAEGLAAKPQVFQFTTATTPSAGTFTSGQETSAGDNGAALGDVDGDGDLDLVSLSYIGGNAIVSLNNGKGVFTAFLEVPLGNAPNRVVLGDVNGDGALDIIGANAGQGNAVSVRLNDGTGDFRGDRGQNVAIGNVPFNVALGDLDGDGDLDMVVGGYYNATTPGGVSVRFNDGTGTFSGTTTLPITTIDSVADVALGDVDGDGDLDLITANQQDKTASVLLNDGTGNFGGKVNVPTSGQPTRVALGDVNGDGALDLLVEEFDAVEVKLNSGGTFTAGQTLALTGAYSDMALGDIDGDGDLDLAVTYSGYSLAYVRLNNGQGTFTNAPDVAVLSSGVRNLALADLNNDGTLDLLAGISVRLNQAPVVVVKTPPTLTSAAPATGVAGSSEAVVLTGTNFTAATTVTFNGTAATGVVVVSATELRVAVPAGASSGPVVATTADGASNGLAFTVLAAGFPRLGVASVAPTPNTTRAPVATPVTVTFGQVPPAGSGIEQALQVFSQQAGGRKVGTSSLSSGTVTFQPSVAFKAGETVLATAVGRPGRVFQFTTATTPSSGTFNGGSDLALGTSLADMVTGDIDGDGDLDVLTANTGNGDISIGLNNGKGVYTDSNNTIFVGNILLSLALGDVDSDGDLDVLATSYVRPYTNISSRVAVYLNDGKGTFTFANSASVGATASRVVLGDLDGDGDLDLVSISEINYASNLNIRLNNGRGVFSGGQDIVWNASELALGDADNDGDLDLFTNQGGGIGLSLNNGQGVFGASQPLGLGTTIGRIVLGDLDGDSDLDVVAFNQVAGTAHVGLNSGTGTFAQGGSVTFSGRALALGDVDGDGDLDLVGASAAGSNLASVRLNNGQGNFAGTQEVSLTVTSAGLPLAAILLSDVDGDGDLDLLAGSPAYAFDKNSVSVRLNQAAAPVAAAYRVRAGGGALTTTRGQFTADQYFDAANTAVGGTSAAISGTPDPALYQQERYSLHGTLSYALPVANGQYTVVLHFAENYWTRAGQRVFDGYLEGAKVLDHYDILKKVARFTATTETFTVAVTDGTLNLDLVVPYESGGADQAKLAALEVLPAAPALYRLRAGGGALATTRGQFAADQYYSTSSRIGGTTVPITGTADQALYQQERYGTNGTLSYALPVANGQYQVVLHFAEIYWSQPGQRVFDGYLESKKVLDHYDIVKKVGPLAATTETFTVAVTDGVLNLDLRAPYESGGADQPKLSAIEVLGGGASSAVVAGTLAATSARPVASLNAYPNPTTGRFTLTLSAPTAQAATLVLTDLVGRVIYQQPVRLQVGSNEVAVEAPGQLQGLYQLSLRTADGQRYGQKIAIRP